jgi:transcriptional regulator with XRE-family HTH domain
VVKSAVDVAAGSEYASGVTRPRPTLETLAMVVRAFRNAKELSQERLADLAELDRTYLGGIERAKKRPTFVALERLLAALDIGWAEFGAELDKAAKRRQ